MPTIVFHHSADFDGLFCGEIARRFLPNAAFRGWDYGDPVEAVTDDDEIYMLDISIDSLMAHPRLTWIDHHKTAMERYAKTPAIVGLRIDGVAACRLAWQWFTDAIAAQALAKEDYVHRRVIEPWAVRLAGEYDIWDKRDSDAELFQHGLRSQNLDASGAWEYMLDDHYDCVEGLLEAGRGIQYAREQEYREVIESQGFTVQFEGLTLLACNSHELDIRSHLFAAGIRPIHEGLLGFTWTGTHWRVSLYGVPNRPDVDLSAIAVRYGGGGHKQACGFQTKSLPFLP